MFIIYVTLKFVMTECGMWNIYVFISDFLVFSESVKFLCSCRSELINLQLICAPKYFYCKLKDPFHEDV